MAVPTFELMTGAERFEPRDFPVKDTTILDPTSSNPLVGGEWLEIDNATKKAQRAVGEMTNPYSGQFWGEKGRYDIRAINKVPLILWGNYEAYTYIYHNPAMPDANTPQTIGQYLSVRDVTYNGQTKKGLFVPTAAGHHFVVGYYYGPGRKTGEIRFMRRDPFDLVI